jgi:tetraacyldisaccharide 4'-kinase
MSLAERLQREWISGGPLSQLLRPVSALYGALLKLRAAFYRLGWLKTETLPVPVIVVGNWIVGGAGKTPTTLALLALLKAQGLRAGVVSRGYGRQDDDVRLVSRSSSATDVGDEPLLIHLRSGVPVAVGRDRVAAARRLLTANPSVQLLVSDDGLQHLRMPRALSVLVFDERGIGNGRLLPSGPLRQPPELIVKADELVLYNATRPSTSLPGALARRRLAGAIRLDAWWAGQPASLEVLHSLRSRRVVATAGMAQPQRFFDMLVEQGLSIEPLPLPDHYDFAPLPWASHASDVVLTEKDAVKLAPGRCGDTHVWVVALDFQPEQAFEQALRDHLARLHLT